jgi:hypothetical protein
MYSIQTKLNEIRDQHSSCMKKQDACFRNLRDSHLINIKESYDEINDAHRAQAWGHVVSMAGAFIQIFAAGFDQNSNIGRGIHSVGSFVEKSGGFKNKIDETTITRYQGILEQVRKELDNTESENRELTQMLHDIERMLDDAREKANRSLDTTFDRAN